MAVTAQKQRAREEAGRQDFQHCLHIVEGISSWQLWSSAVVILLLPAVLVVLSFAPQLGEIGLFQNIDPGWAVRALLGVAWIVSTFAYFRQRGQISLLRKGLIEQTDMATKNRVRGEQFYGQSILDPLTGLYNRRFGETRLTEEIARAQESDDPLLLLAFDFDRFKQINDQLGHAAGDMALKEFSRRLQRAIRACDVPIRVGGDEFLLILPECPPESVKLIFSRMGQISFNAGGKQIPLFFSFGMAQHQVNDTPETMIKRADERLYEAKAQRKTREQAEKACEQKQSPAPATDSECTPDDKSGSENLGRGSSGHTRRSARIPTQIPVVLIGNDLLGKVFTEHTKTANVSRHGLGVVSKLKIAPDQELIVRRTDTNKEAHVRVVRAKGSKSRTHTYGLEFTGPDNNIWDLEPQTLTGSEEEFGASLYECRGCKTRKKLDNIKGDLDTQTGNKDGALSCHHCGCETNWIRIEDGQTDGQAAKEPEALSPEVTVN